MNSMTSFRLLKEGKVSEARYFSNMKKTLEYFEEKKYLLKNNVLP
jgi:hypothetical protein